MKYYLTVLFVFCITSKIVFAQDAGYLKVKEVYESFEHEKVIQLSNELLKATSLSDSLLVDIYLMRAVSFYTIGDEINCKNSFNEILKLKKNFEPDPSAISPKIISLFNDTKMDFLKSSSPSTASDSTLSDTPVKIFDSGLLSACAVKNIFVPGWGQFQAGSTSKGIILSAASTAALVSMLYYISDTNKKENDYLNAYNRSMINDKYNAYNKSYKIRNILIVSYAAVWLFSQFDLFFLTNTSSSSTETVSPNGISSNLYLGEVRLDFRVPF